MRFILLMSLMLLCPVLYTEAYMEVEFERLTARYAGYSSYSIGGAVLFPDTSRATLHFPLSELRFEQASLFDMYQLSLRHPYFFTVLRYGSDTGFKPSGTLYDSDWLYSTTEKDIYSESTASLKRSVLSWQIHSVPVTINTFFLRHLLAKI